jgi:hypothetical protein
MSEPLSSNDIEDVLSSIRRLVSEDLRPAAPVPAAAAAPVDASEKLILTPALRVVEQAEPAATRPQVTYPRTVEIPAFDAEAVAGDRVDPVAMQKVFATVSAAASEAEAGSEDPAEAPMFDGAAMTPEEESAAVPAWAQIGFDEVETETETEAAQAAPAAPPFVRPDWADAVAASAIASLAEEEGAPAPRATAALEQAEEALFNEEVLRDLVRDILREEFAGSLGERITRNIRKLVRAELARSLAAQDLD